MGISEANLERAVCNSALNRFRLKKSVQCGCFFCFEMFEAQEITEWVDGGMTALCPACGIDSVLLGATDPINPEFLRAMFKRWFASTDVADGTE